MGPATTPSSFRLSEHVPLAPRTTLELGGAARYFVEATDERVLLDALQWAEAERIPAVILGGGSNLVVPDGGYPGLVIAIGTRGIARQDRGGEAVLTVKAGEPWDEVVAYAVSHELAGLECLSGIPGLTGATPIQNVGAYGQEVADTMDHVLVYDRESRQARPVDRGACGFGYRTSRFKRAPGQHVVLEVTFRLKKGGPPSVRYAELERTLRDREPSLAVVREAVLALRRAKSMVIDEADDNRRSAGSFFTNPIVDDATADRIVADAVRAGLASNAEAVPRYPAGPGQSKLAAGWLIERAGIQKGLRKGPVGISTRHALALVHHGGGTTRELLALAEHVRERVRATFGVELEQEPVLLG